MSLKPKMCASESVFLKHTQTLLMLTSCLILPLLASLLLGLFVIFKKLTHAAIKNIYLFVLSRML